MNLILVGCEYVGKTTLADQIVLWTERVTGAKSSFHDHFGFPPSGSTPPKQRSIKHWPNSSTRSSRT